MSKKQSHEQVPDEDGCILDPEFFSPSGAAYKPERDGKLLDYLLPQIKSGSCMRVFHGSEQEL